MTGNLTTTGHLAIMVMDPSMTTDILTILLQATDTQDIMTIHTTAVTPPTHTGEAVPGIHTAGITPAHTGTIQEPPISHLGIQV